MDGYVDALIPLLDTLPAHLRGPALAVLAETTAEEARFGLAAELLTAAAAFFEFAGEAVLRDEALIDAAALLARSGQVAAAESTLGTWVEHEDPWLKARSLMSRGCARAMQRQDTEALDDLRAALDLLRQLEPTDETGTLWLDALGCRFDEIVCDSDGLRDRLNELREVRDAYRRAGYRTQSAACDLIEAAVLIESESYDAALQVIDAVIADCDAESPPSLLAECGQRRAAALRGLGRPEAVDEYERLISTLEGTDRDLALALAFDGRAKLAELPGSPGRRGADAALEFYRASAEALERGLRTAAIDELRAEQLRRALPDPFGSVCRLLVDRYGVCAGDGVKRLDSGPELAQVFEWSECGRSAAFRADLRLGGSRSTGYVTDVVSAEEVASALGAGELLVSYILTEDPKGDSQGLISIVVDAQGVSTGWHDLTGGRRIAELLARFRADVECAEKGEYTPLPGERPAAWIDREHPWDDILEELGSLLLPTSLLNPLERGVKRIVFVPYGELHDVPFAALRSQRAFDGYLIEHFEVIVDPQASVRARVRERPRSTCTGLVAGLGDADANRALRYTGDVLRSLRSLGDAFGEVTVCGSARELLEAAEAASVVVVYSHGVFLNDAPLESYFELGQESDVDGQLSARAVASHGLNLDLFVAAACDSSRGRIAPGEALQGFRRAALTSARCVLGTLWKVWELPTHVLLRSLMGRLAQGLEPAAALREVQLELLAGGQDGYESGHPYYWAGLVVTGDSLPLSPKRPEPSAR